MLPETVKRTILIEAPRARVWQALNEPEQIAKWLLPPTMGAQIKRDADRLVVCIGPMEMPIATVEEVDEPQTLTLRSWPDGIVSAHCRLTDESQGTRVTVTVNGFERFPADAQQDRLAPTAAGWDQTLANVEAVVKGAEVPHPAGRATTLFGYRRTFKQTFSVERSIWIAASRERVWDAITDPAQMEQWFSPGTSWKLSALEEGGELFAPDPETGAHRYTQVIRRLVRPEQLILASTPEPPETSHVTDYLLSEENGGTRLTINSSGYEFAPEDTRGDSLEQNGAGYAMMLQNIKAHAEGAALPFPFGF